MSARLFSTFLFQSNNFSSIPFQTKNLVGSKQSNSVRSKDNVKAGASANTDDIDVSSKNRRSTRSKKGEKKPTPPEAEPSLLSFEGSTRNQQLKRTNFNSVIITDALSDVRQRYHINPKE